MKNGKKAPNEPVADTVEILSGKWKLQILRHLLQLSPQRFGELRKRIPGISQRVLTTQLRELERDGLISRKTFSEIPPRVEYGLTTKALELSDVCGAIEAWKKRFP